MQLTLRQNKSSSEDLEEQGNVGFRRGAKYGVSMSTDTSLYASRLVVLVDKLPYL